MSSNSTHDTYYFDHNATTPVRPEVLETFTRVLRDSYGNASSSHSAGRNAKRILEESRVTVAGLIGAEPDEIVFTGCGTEADNMAIAGILNVADKRHRLVTTDIEHSAVLKTSNIQKNNGVDVMVIGVDNDCTVDFDALETTIGDNTALVSVMHANNETGVIQNIRAVSEIAHEAGALFHTDAVQSAGKIPIDVQKMGIDLLSLSGHKFNAPKGVGVLFVRRGVTIKPLLYGGSHENGLRPGTENTAGIAAFTHALELAVSEMEENARKLSALRDRLEDGIERMVPNVLFNGQNVSRLPGTSNVSIPGIDGESLLFSLDRRGIAASSGSACSTGDIKPSHVLIAMGREPKVAQSSLRFSMGYGTTGEGVDHILNVLPATVERLRNISSGL